MQKKSIYYNDIVLGAMLKFNQVDVVDLYLFENDLSRIYDFRSWYSNPHSEKFQSINNIYINNCGIVKYDVSYGISRDILQNDIRKTIDCYLIKYFDALDIERYKIKKEKFLEEQKKSLLEDGFVLLVSSNEKDYEELLKYGFKNVDYFKSIIRAENYFSKNNRELEKYNITLIGENVYNLSSSSIGTVLETMLKEIPGNRFDTNLREYDFGDYIDFVSFFGNRNGISCRAEEKSYKDIFDKIVECASVYEVMKDIPKREFKQIEQYQNIEKLHYPTKKQDLKILCLTSVPKKEVSDYIKKLPEMLDLNIEFREDCNYTLRNIQNILGCYDIIIATKIFSSNLLKMDKECVEQCIDTGRNLTLLMTYEDNHIDRIINIDKFDYDSYGFGDLVKLNYKGGSSIFTKDICNMQYRVLRNTNIDYKDEWLKYVESKCGCLKSVIEQAVLIYDEELKLINGSSLEDLNFKSYLEYDEEFLEYEKMFDEIEMKKELKRMQELKPIQDFEKFENEIFRYLEYRKIGLVSSYIPGVLIKETNDGVLVQLSYNSRITATITIPKNNHNDIKTFMIQTVNKKGNIGVPQLVGLYTSDSLNIANLPKKPDEKQMTTINAIYKKINQSICPLNDEAYLNNHKNNRHKSYKREWKRMK